MKKLLAIFAVTVGLAPLSMHGQTTATVMTVDMNKVYNSYEQAERSKEQFQQAVEKAQEEMRVMLDEGIKMAKDLQEVQEKLDNPALSEAARAKFQKQVDEKGEEVRKKEVEVNTFRQQTDRELMERREAFVTKHVDEIKDVAKRVADKRKVNLVLNTSSFEIVYADPVFDASDEIIAELNKGSTSKPPATTLPVRGAQERRRK